MAEAMEVDDFPVDLPKFNRYSYAVINSCKERLLQDQWEALENLRVWFNQGKPGIALVCMPTGSGKTGIICCLPYFLGKEGLNEVPGHFPTGNPRHLFDKPVMVIAPNLNISDQLEEQMLISAEDASGLNFLLRHGIINNKQRRALPSGLKIEETKKLNGPNSANYLQGREVIIANAQKFLKGNWEEDLPDDLFKLVIVDEAHHFPAKTWKKIITKFKKDALVVFFTATPYRGDKKTVVPQPFAYHLPLQPAIDRRIIRNTKFFQETAFTLPELSFSREPTPEELRELNAFWGILNKVREIQERKDRESPLPNNVPHMAFAIAKNTIYADTVADLWNSFIAKCEDSAMAYHSESKELPKRLEKIKNNRVRLVVVVEMLQEGFDHPPISIAAIMTNITSPTKFVQFIGRAQRIARGPGGKESATIAADIVTHSHFQQQENYDKFRNEKLLVIRE